MQRQGYGDGVRPLSLSLQDELYDGMRVAQVIAGGSVVARQIKPDIETRIAILAERLGFDGP